MSRQQARQKLHERTVAERFCMLYSVAERTTCRIAREDEGPDFWMEVGGTEVGLELARYRELGPHNNSHSADEILQRHIVAAWLAEQPLQHYTPHLYFHQRPTHFVVPGTETARQGLVRDLVDLVRSLSREQDRSVAVEFCPRSDYTLCSEMDPGVLWAAEELYPVLSDHCRRVVLEYHPYARTTGAHTSLNVRNTGVDFAQLVQVTGGKLARLVQYRAKADGRALWLLIYSQPWPPTAQLPHAACVEAVVTHLRQCLGSAADSFDAAWWGEDITPGAGMLHRIL